jgi:hypothetical protein
VSSAAADPSARAEGGLPVARLTSNGASILRRSKLVMVKLRGAAIAGAAAASSKGANKRIMCCILAPFG